jgi:hypothetical protein
MQCILYKIYFWKVFHMYCKLICILYALLCGQNFILVKMWVLQGMGMLAASRDRSCRGKSKGGIRELEGSQKPLGKLSTFFKLT